MDFFVLAALSLIVIAIPVGLWLGLSRLSVFTGRSEKHEELAELENSISVLLAEMEQRAEALTEEAESVSRALKNLINEADERVATLQRAHSEKDRLPMPEPGQRINYLPERKRQRDKIALLSREGWGPARIAKETGLATGEVELILNLEANELDHGREPVFKK